MANNMITQQEKNGIALITIMTNLTTNMEKQVNDIYNEVKDKGYKKILIQFQPENHITSGGIAILIGILSESRKWDQQIGITGLSEHFKKTFKMIGITRYTTIYDSVEDALQTM